MKKQNHMLALLYPTIFRLLLPLLAAGMLLAGCSRAVGPEVKTYGPAWNAERAKRGITPIPKGWRPEHSWAVAEVRWSSPAPPAMGKPMHFNKYVSWNAKGITLEQDTFFSGGKVTERDPDWNGAKTWEEVVLSYDYREPDQPWSFFYNGDPATGPKTLEEARELVRSWGLTP